MRNNNIRYIVVLVAALIFAALVGRLFYIYGQQHPVNGAKNQPLTGYNQESTTTAASLSKTEASSTAATSSESVSATNQNSSCVMALQAQIKSRNITYDKKSLLATFSAGIGYPEAVADLASHGLAPQDQSAEESYGDRRLIVVAVPNSNVLETICVLRTDSSVTYAGFNTLFNLHE